MSVTTLRDLLDRWHAERSDPERLRRLDPLPLARDALALGCPTLACEILRVCGADEGGGPQARYLAALAHARVGASARAMAMAVSLLDDPAAAALRSDALALAGRIAKDRWSRLPPGEEREHAGRQSMDCYRRAWESTGDFFPGVNAATMRLLAGDAGGARELAAKVRATAASASGVEPHWREATLGECSLLLGEVDAAYRHYRAAVAAAGRQVGDIASMRRQLRLLGRSIEVPPALLDVLAIPRIVVFSGHMVDAADRGAARLPAAIAPRLAARIAERLDALGAGYGYCSAACGADLLFIEAMLARGAEVHVTLPFAREDFIAASVAFAGSDWTARFERALEAATSVGYGVQERFLGDESLYGYAGTLIQGAALMRARELETEPMMLAVLDAAAERRDGGTRDLVENWRRLGLPLEIVDPAALRDGLPGSPAAASTPATAIETRSTPLRRQVRTMLFADMVGFSRLQEEDTPSFLVHFLGAIAEMLQRCGHPPDFVNTWGDGLFMVFDEVGAGVEFALQLRDAVQRTDWAARGLPAGTSVRMGMHTGPVFEALDPLIGRPNYFGSHVVRAARIEPVAVPGAVYVSAELAFSLAASGAAGFATDYLGVLPLAKGYGSGPLYRLRRSDAAE
jgi:class 3 adenylate cyclase